MGEMMFSEYRYLPSVLAIILLLLFFSLEGCSSGGTKERDRAIALVKNYQIRGKRVSERISYALQHSTNEKINTLEWNALKDKKNIYKVTCIAKIGDREIHFAWLANLSSNRITPLNMNTQDIMGGGFY